MNRVAYLVGHHHSPEQINGIDYQILIEADYIRQCVRKRVQPAGNPIFYGTYHENSGRYSTDENSIWSITEKFAAKREKIDSISE